MRLEIHNPVGTIFREIAEGHTQRSVAITYAFIMRQEPDADWPKINRAITERWKGKTALERVKTMAWEFYEGRA